MPTILSPRGDENDAIGTDAIAVRRWSLDAGAESRVGRSDDEVLLYVIAGGGSARVADAQFPLAPESVVWLDPGDVCVLVAGPDGLDALEGRAGPAR